MGYEYRYKELLWSVEVVKEKRWVFKRSMEVQKKIIVSETNCRSSNKKNHGFWVKIKRIVTKCGSCERKKMGIWTKYGSWEKIIVSETKCRS